MSEHIHANKFMDKIMKCTCCQRREGTDRGPGYGSFCGVCLLFEGGECCAEWANDYAGWCKRTKINPHDVPDVPKIITAVNAYVEIIKPKKNKNPKYKNPKYKYHTCTLGNGMSDAINCKKCEQHILKVIGVVCVVFILIVTIIVTNIN